MVALALKKMILRWRGVWCQQRIPTFTSKPKQRPAPAPPLRRRTRKLWFGLVWSTTTGYDPKTHTEALKSVQLYCCYWGEHMGFNCQPDRSPFLDALASLRSILFSRWLLMYYQYVHFKCIANLIFVKYQQCQMSNVDNVKRRICQNVNQIVKMSIKLSKY